MKKYIPTIGLEIHAELNTKTKMFCNSLNDADEKKPNVNICEVCMAEPGALPVINKEAVKSILKIGLSLNGKLADFTEFDRKNYFYPDIPKGYQISQYKYPLVTGGELNGVSITRIHLEEDTARSTHQSGDYSLIDFNRAGVPLMELVTDPVIRSASQASDFAKELQMILRYLGVSNADMEKGNMRVEVNVSVARSNDDQIESNSVSFDGHSGTKLSKLGTKVEVKNLNSFKVVEKAIEYEIKRQSELLDNGGKVVQETRGWDETTGKTFSQRIKEDSHDYRYFPDPDLPKLFIDQIPEFSHEELRKEIPELPEIKRIRYEKDYSLTPDEIEFFIRNKDFDDVFVMSVAHNTTNREGSVKLISNYIISDLVSESKQSPNILKKKEKISKDIAVLVSMILDNKISSRGAKDILKIAVLSDKSILDIFIEQGASQINNEKEIENLVKKIIDANPKVVAEYKKGKEGVLQFLIGQGMKESKGKANPEILKKVFISLLK